MRINNFALHFKRGVIFTVLTGFLVASVTAQPVEATGGLTKALRCAAIKTFGVASQAAITIETKLMEASFKLGLELLELKWKIQDAATEAGRNAAESLFKGLLNVYEKLFAKTAEKVAAVDKYRVDKLLALSLFHDDYDSAQASYREDMLALIKGHHDKLRAAVATFSSDIKAAVAEAMSKCGNFGVLISLTGDVVQAKAKFIKAVVAEEVRALVKAVQLRTTRNLEILKLTAALLSKAHELRVTLTNTMHGWN